MEVAFGRVRRTSRIDAARIDADYTNGTDFGWPVYAGRRMWIRLQLSEGVTDSRASLTDGFRLLIADSLSPIPFKRESVFRGELCNRWQGHECFNSLQTGKCIQSPVHSSGLSSVPVCFNSLQTGKCIQRRKFLIMRLSWEGKCFNSLQTGKCIQRDPSTSTKKPLSIVSIPFKRESVFRENQHVLYSALDRFQFPSNGKVYSEVSSKLGRLTGLDKVSIPFKRESVFRGNSIL